MFVDTITRQNFNYATPISCNNNPQQVIALDPDNDEQYVRTPKPVLRATPTLFEPKQVQSAIGPYTFTAQEIRSYSNVRLAILWNRILITKHSDTTMKLLGKAISFDFLATSEKHPTDLFSTPCRKRLFRGVGLHDHLSDIALLFALDWFTDAFIAKFRLSCLILTQCLIYFSNFPFLHYVVTFLLKIHKSTSISYTLHENINILISTAQKLFEFYHMKTDH